MKNARKIVLVATLITSVNLLSLAIPALARFSDRDEGGGSDPTGKAWIVGPMNGPRTPTTPPGGR
jgi:hypothetical protein